MQTKTKQHTRHTSRNPRVVFMAMIAMLLPLASCINDNYDEEPTALSGKTVSMEMSIQTRASTDDETEVGTIWENYIDIANGDFRIYFFTYDPTEQTTGGTNSTLIAEFKPTDIYSTDLDTYTTYTMSGEVDEALVSSLKNFKVVVLANWGVYPTVTAGTTTIDDICEGSNTTFNGRTMLRLGVGANRLIPFYGVCEYSDVEFKVGKRTTLSEKISLLRALAKIEVILTEDSDIDSFSSVRIMACNRYGYCAPKGVYLKSDYIHDDSDIGYTTSLHLQGGENDKDARTDDTYEFIPQTDAGTDTRIAYMAEYDNTSNAGVAGSDDYSYIQVRIGNMSYYNIYFGNYVDGVCTAYDEEGDSNERFDIFRNNLYRFYVTYKEIVEHEFTVDLTIINDETDGYFNNVSHFE